MTVQPLSLFAEPEHASGAAPLQRQRVRHAVRPASARKNRADGAAQDDSGRRRDRERAVSAGEPRPALRCACLQGAGEFLAGKDYSVGERFDALKSADDEINIDGNGAVLERGCVYVIPLIEHLNLPDSISAIANPKSSTGRLDIFTRLITDKSDVFDRVARGYEGRLYAEVSPRSFSVLVRKGSKLNQIRFRRLNSQQLEGSDFGIKEKVLRERHEKMPLVDGDLQLWRNGLVVRVGLGAEPADGGDRIQSPETREYSRCGAG